MNQVILKLKISTDTKQRAAEIVRCLQAMCTGTKDGAASAALNSVLDGDGHANIIEASYRDRRNED